MGNSNQDTQITFRRLVKEAVKEGLNFLKSQDLSNKNIGGYWNSGSMSYSKSGMPSFSMGPFIKGPIDYKNVFQGFNPLKSAEELKSFSLFFSFVMKNKYIKLRLFHPTEIEKMQNSSLDQALLKVVVYNIPLKLIDRYIHVNKAFDFTAKAFQEIYEPLARSIFHEKLNIHICIPILFLKFSFNQIELGPHIFIERMDEKFQLARIPLKAPNPRVHDLVLSAATHALVLKNWNFENKNLWSLFSKYSDAQFYPLDNINNFFASLRTITNFDTGYAQLLMHPINWAQRYIADLPPLEGTSIKAYPNKFENYYWLNENIPEIDDKTAEKIGDLFIKLNKTKQNSVRIAVKRLNLCFNRDEEEDSILDVCIALEALLISGNGKQEMTHKLATRAGALGKLFKLESKSPADIFEDIKKIYSYRSAVIHGSTKISKTRVIILEGKSPITTISLAIDYLRNVLHTLIDNPEYLKSEKIDKELLLGSNDASIIKDQDSKPKEVAKSESRK